jgi:hypothetical protein
MQRACKGCKLPHSCRNDQKKSTPTATDEPRSISAVPAGDAAEAQPTSNVCSQFNAPAPRVAPPPAHASGVVAGVCQPRQHVRGCPRPVRGWKRTARPHPPGGRDLVRRGASERGGKPRHAASRAARKYKVISVG